MRKVSKIMLIVWDILLIPVIITVVLSFFAICELNFGETIPMSRVLALIVSFFEFITYFFAAFSQLLIPQIISLILITLNWAMPFRFWESTPKKKEIILILMLSVVSIIGAVCAVIALAMMTAGEAGIPLS